MYIQLNNGQTLQTTRIEIGGIGLMFLAEGKWEFLLNEDVDGVSDELPSIINEFEEYNKEVAKEIEILKNKIYS